MSILIISCLLSLSLKQSQQICISAFLAWEHEKVAATGYNTLWYSVLSWILFMHITTVVCYEHRNELTYQFCHTGILINNTWAWKVYMPSRIYGLHKSCLVIPCSFDYYYSPSVNPSRVVWYEYVSRGYPKVFDSRSPNSVIDKYKGRTSLYNSNHKDCSLLIKDLSFSHSGDKIYTWIDPENVGWRTYKFYDVNTVIYVNCKCYIYLPFK